MPLLLLIFHIYCTKNLPKATGTFFVKKDIAGLDFRVLHWRCVKKSKMLLNVISFWLHPDTKNILYHLPYPAPASSPVDQTQPTACSHQIYGFSPAGDGEQLFGKEGFWNNVGPPHIPEGAGQPLLVPLAWRWGGQGEHSKVTALGAWPKTQTKFPVSSRTGPLCLGLGGWTEHLSLDEQLRST